MKLRFTKRSGKSDELLIERRDTPVERIDCPKQGIIPHDMVHFAVEKFVARNGFLSRVASGEASQFRMTPQNDTEAIERLVETMQAEAWSGRDPSFRKSSPEELIDLYRIACATRSHACLPVAETDIDLIRQEIETLTQQWNAVPVNGSLTLTLTGVAPSHPT